MSSLTAVQARRSFLGGVPVLVPRSDGALGLVMPAVIATHAGLAVTLLVGGVVLAVAAPLYLVTRQSGPAVRSVQAGVSV